MNEDERIERDCNSCNCISEIVERIIHLQKNSFNRGCHEGCDRPFLGPDSVECFNTRPVSFYNCTIT